MFKYGTEKVFLSNDVENLFWIIVQRSVYINIGNVDIVIKKKLKIKGYS